jgi:conjugal transfer pilus assembly protein TraB
MKVLKRLKEHFMGDDDYTLKTYEDTDRDIQQGVKKNIGKILFIMIILVPIVLILVKTTYRYFEYHYTKKPNIIEKKEEKSKNTDMKISNDRIWKTKSEEKQRNLESDIGNVKKSISDLDIKFGKSSEQIKQQIKEQSESTIKQQEEIKALIKEQNLKTNDNLEQTKKAFRKDLEIVKEDVKKDSLTSKINLNKLVALNPLSPPEETIPKPKEEEKEKQVEYIEIASTEFNVSTYDNYEEKTEKKKPKRFILDAGFGKATILAAGEFNTIAKGKDERVPVFLSIDSEIITANDEQIDLKGCILRGAGVGNFTTSRTAVTVTKIDCKLTDSDGIKYRISQKIQAVLYDETGGYALKGRLITKEGEVFAKAIPIAFLETGLNILTEKANTKSNTGDVISFGQNASKGVSDTGQTIVNKMGEYWLKYLDALNPKIDIRPGRQVYTTPEK